MGGFLSVGARNWTTVGSTSIADTATLLVARRNDRNGCLVDNIHATKDMFIGPDSSLSTSNGKLVPAGKSIFLETQGDIYAIVGASTGTADAIEYHP